MANNSTACERRAGQRRRLMGATALLAGATAMFTGGCASGGGTPLVTSEMTATEIRTTLDASVTPGMTLSQVNAELDALHIANMRRRAYAGNPDQLLVRIAPREGFWVDAPYLEFRYVDAWFVFDGQKKYQRLDLEEKQMRYQAGEWMNPPFQSPDVLPNKPREVPGK